MPPTIGGNHVPYDSGQSGTASPESVDVTNPPAIKRKKVATAVTTAKMFMAVLMEEWLLAVRRNRGRLGLRQPILGTTRDAVLIRPVVHGGGLGEVAVGWRRGGHPFQRVGLPRIRPGRFASEQAPEEVHDEKELRREEDEGADAQDRKSTR